MTDALLEPVRYEELVSLGVLIVPFMECTVSYDRTPIPTGKIKFITLPGQDLFAVNEPQAFFISIDMIVSDRDLIGDSPEEALFKWKNREGNNKCLAR